VSEPEGEVVGGLALEIHGCDHLQTHRARDDDLAAGIVR
jgi:hypothetical protein